ncbi:MAG: aminomethyltransferase family protein [Hyphomicrobiaceae bacterium]
MSQAADGKQRGYAASHSVIRLSSKRYSFSPYATCYARPDMVWGLYSGRFYALGWGDDPVAAYRTLKSHAVLYDVPEHPIQISGREAPELLRRVFCRRVDTLRIGVGRYCIACRDDGGVLMDGVLFRLDESLYWYVPADGEFVPWLKALSIGLDVQITDPRSWVIQVQGPKAFDILADVWDREQAHALAYFHIRPCRIAGQELYVSRTGWTGEMGFELYTRHVAPDGPSLWTHLLEVGRAHGLVAGSLESMGIRRIEAGILDNGTDIDEGLNPYQAGLGKFVDLDAGAFVGRQALRSADRRPLLLGVISSSTTPVSGMRVLKDGRDVGRITTGAWSPTLEAGIGYARFESLADWLGEDVMLRSGGGEAAEARVTALPFYDPEKRIPRGLAN